MSYQLQSQNYSLQQKNPIEKKYHRAKRGRRWERPQKIKTNCFYYSVSYRYSRRSGTQLRDPWKSHIGFFNLAIQAKIICPYTALWSQPLSDLLILTPHMYLKNPWVTRNASGAQKKFEKTYRVEKLWLTLVDDTSNANQFIWPVTCYIHLKPCVYLVNQKLYWTFSWCQTVHHLSKSSSCDTVTQH